MKIIIYTIPTCQHSIKAMRFFKRKKLKFEEKTLFKEKETRLEVIDLTGQLSTPVIKIDDQVILGFNEDKIKAILKSKK